MYVGRHNQLANIIHQQIAMKYKLLDRNTPPYSRYKLEPMLESGNMILHWDKYIVTHKTVDFNRHDIVLKDTQNKTTLVIDVAVPLTFPKLRQRKLWNMKTWPWK